jgi:adenylate kinase
VVRVICTGISGTERAGILEEARTLAAQAGRDLQIFDVGDAMFQIAQDVGEPVEEETILDMFPHALVLLRAAALEKISSLCEQADQYQDWIINTHAVFRWKNTLISGFDPHYLERLDPHLFVTVTSGIRTAHARLRAQPRWSGLSQEDLLIWREEEQFFTEEMARIHRKSQILLPRTIGLEALYRLLFEPGCRRAYLSYPMQHVAPGEQRGLAAFKAQLAQQYVVFDPADVNDALTEGLLSTDGSTGVGVGLGPVPDSRLQQHIADQIVERDYKLIEQSEAVVVFYDVAVPSPGVISEMKFALESGKQVFGVWLPSSQPSVFFTRYCSTWFRSPDELFAYLERRGRRAVSP